MARVDFIISNDRHHVAMIRPVIERLTADPEVLCRVLSLCEFRGLRSPAEQFQMDRVEFERVLTRNLRWSPALGKQTRPGHPGLARRLARALAWAAILRPPLSQAFRAAPDLVVMLNDAAFPYDRIARLLLGKRLPFLLLQEGIRFPLPAIPADEDYGRNGAQAIAVWGQASADYFASRGVPRDVLHVTGAPRFDGVPGPGSEATGNRARAQWNLTGRLLLFLTNPIDDQGFCTTREKLDLAHRFARGILPLFEEPDFHLVVKLHSRESPTDYRPVFQEIDPGRMTILTDAPLHELFAAAEAAVVMASTVGLEALLHDVALGLLEIPGHGYLYDYVESGAAVGISWEASLAPQIRSLMSGDEALRERARAYLDHQLAHRGSASEKVEQLIRRRIEKSDAQAH